MTAAQVEEEAKAWGHTPYTPNSGPSTLPATPISFGRYLDNPNTYLPSARERSGEYMWSPHVQAPYPFNSAHHVNSSPSMVANYVAIEPSQSHHRESEARNSSPSPVSSPTPQSSPSTPETCPPKKRKVPHTPTKEETANPVPKRKSSGDRDSPQMEPVPRAAHRMKQFSAAQVSDWKHVLYNLLVESHNSDNNSGCLVCPVEVLHVGQKRQGFSFNPNLQPRKKDCRALCPSCQKGDIGTTRSQVKLYRGSLQVLPAMRLPVDVQILHEGGTLHLHLRGSSSLHRR